MSRLRPHTVKASLSDEEKKAIASIAKRHKLSEAELIRFVLCNINEFDIDFGSAENVDQKSRSEEIHIKVSPAEKKKGSVRPGLTYMCPHGAISLTP